jgi:flagellar protein FliS
MDGTLGAYRNVAIATADPGALVLQLFDGALRFLARASKALAAGDTAGFALAVNRAHAIIAELSNSLDREAGSAAAEDLDRLYDFMLRYLTEGLAQKSAPHVERVVAMLLPVRDGFDAALRG